MITTINSALKYTPSQQMELLSEFYVFMVFNHILEIMVQEGLFLLLLKSIKSDSEPLTVIPLSDVVYF